MVQFWSEEFFAVNCECDRYYNTKTNKCEWCGTDGKYKPKGLVVKGKLTEKTER